MSQTCNLFFLFFVLSLCVCGEDSGTAHKFDCNQKLVFCFVWHTCNCNSTCNSLSGVEFIYGRNSITSSASSDSVQEVSRLTERTRLLEKENTELTKELERAIDQNTRMCQTIIQLETSRDKLKTKFHAFKQDTGYDFVLCLNQNDC